VKKIILVVLTLGLVAVSASGCAKKEAPAQQTLAETAQAPAPAAVQEAAVRTEVAASIVPEGIEPVAPEEIKDLEKSLTVEGVTSSAQDLTRGENVAGEEKAIEEGTTSAAETSSEGLTREEGTIEKGETAAAETSSEAAIREEGAAAEKA